MACQVYLTRNAHFVCKTFDQALLKDQWRFLFHAKLHPTNYRYCDVELQTKHTNAIVLHIFLEILLIWTWKWQRKIELFNIYPYQSVWWQKLCSNRKHVMDSLWWRRTRHARNSIPKIDGISCISYSSKDHELATPLLLPPQEMTHQLPKRTNIKELRKSTT